MRIGEIRGGNIRRKEWRRLNFMGFKEVVVGITNMIWGIR